MVKYRDTVEEILKPAIYIAENNFTGKVSLKVIRNGFFGTCTVQIYADDLQTMHEYMAAIGLDNPKEKT